jgi:hypothetical protein
VKNTFLLIFIFLFSVHFAFSQKKEKTKTVRDTSYVGHRANQSAIFSAVLPGAGQFYNKKYWKLPILYGGATVIGLAIEYNNRYYKIFREAYQLRVDGDSTTIDKFDPVNTDVDVAYPDADALLTRRDYYRRTRDLMWIIGSVVYVLNIIDAYVDAHLNNFDISDNLSMRTEPSIQFTHQDLPVTSISVSFNLH